MPDEITKTMTAQEIAEHGRQQGRLEERVEAQGRSLREYVNFNDSRVLRLEDKITEGFAQGQRDREAGNLELGNLIKANAVETKLLSDKISKGQGALSLGDKIMSAVLVIAASALGAWLSHQ